MRFFCLKRKARLTADAKGRASLKDKSVLYLRPRKGPLPCILLPVNYGRGFVSGIGNT